MQKYQEINLQLILKSIGNKTNSWDDPSIILSKATHLNLEDKFIKEIVF